MPGTIGSPQSGYLESKARHEGGAVSMQNPKLNLRRFGDNRIIRDENSRYDGHAYASDREISRRDETSNIASYE